jgi:hypothetical protein
LLFLFQDARTFILSFPFISLYFTENPLDCTSEGLDWVDRPNITLLNLENTVCAHPPHQNKPKPILQTIHLIKVRQKLPISISKLMVKASWPGIYMDLLFIL